MFLTSQNLSTSLYQKPELDILLSIKYTINIELMTLHHK